MSQGGRTTSPAIFRHYGMSERATGAARASTVGLWTTQSSTHWDCVGFGLALIGISRDVPPIVASPSVLSVAYSTTP